MDFTMDCKEVFEALMLVKPYLNARQPLPILTHALFEADQETQIVTITATDLEVAVRFQFKAEVEDQGYAVIPALDLIDMLKGKKGTFNLESFEVDNPCHIEGRVMPKGHRVKVSFDNGMNVTLACLDPSNYPAWINMSDIEYKTVDTKEFQSALKRVGYAAAAWDDNRYNLNGICLDGETLITTDGHRLETTKLTDVNGNPLINSKVLIPKTALRLLTSKIFGKNTTLLVGFDKKNIVVSVPGKIITVRLIEGDYPDYTRVIPVSQPSKTVTVNRADFLSAIKEFKPMVSDRQRGVNLSVNGLIEINAKHPDKGEMTLKVNLESTHGEDYDCIMNQVYLTDALSVGKTKTVDMLYYKEGDPVAFKSADQDSILMPMRK
jgi:DNA polymerase-3 subunit beta